MKPTTLIFLIAALVLAVTHYFSLELYLYWRYLWLDMPMHLLGGAVVALGYLSLRDFIPRLPSRWFRPIIVVGFVFLIAVLWELFEQIIGVEFDHDRYVIDTLSDLIMGLLGGTIGYFVGSRIQDSL